MIVGRSFYRIYSKHRTYEAL